MLSTATYTAPARRERRGLWGSWRRMTQWLELTLWRGRTALRRWRNRHAVNAALGDESFILVFNRKPDALTDETLRIRTHLSYVERLLRGRATAELSQRQRRARATVLDLLHQYWVAGAFPSNTNPAYRGTRRPCFIDASGNICAIGYLIERTAGRFPAEAINRQWHSAYLQQMVSPSLEAWVARSGLTAEECAMIQPGYCEGGEDEEYEKYKESIKDHIKDEYKDADINELEEVIKRLGKEQDEAIILQEFERGAQIRDKAMQLNRNRERILTERREQNNECDDKKKDEEKVKERQIEPSPAPKRPPFNERARKVMSLARQEAQRLNVEFITTEHILLGIIQEGGGAAAKVLKNLNVDLKRIRREIEKLITPSTSPTLKLSQLPWSPRAKRVIENACQTASQLGHDVVGTEHLLLGLLKENEGIAPQVLANFDLKLEEVRDMVLNTHSTGTWSPYGGRLPRTGR